MHRGYFGLNGLDKKMEVYLNYNNGFFVELGANDGYTQSNTIYFEKKKNWRGILIEPSPHLFLRCCYFRGGQRNKMFCCACVPFEFSEKYVDIEYADLMSVSANLESDIENKERFNSLANKVSGDTKRNIKFGALARTLTSVLDEADAPKEIDFLSLDVEGAELDVLKGVDFMKYKFRYLLVECRDIERLKGFLGGWGYRCIDQLSKHDYLFTSVKQD